MLLGPFEVRSKISKKRVRIAIRAFDIWETQAWFACAVHRRPAGGRATALARRLLSPRTF